MKLTERLLSQSRQAGCVAVFLSAALSVSNAQTSPTVQRGLNLAMANCARCHAIDRVSDSPLRIAPPFRELRKRYPVETLEEALAEGIQTGHPSMPEFRLDPGQIADVIALLKSLE